MLVHAQSDTCGESPLTAKQYDFSRFISTVSELHSRASCDTSGFSERKGDFTVFVVTAILVCMFSFSSSTLPDYSSDWVNVLQAMLPAHPKVFRFCSRRFVPSYVSALNYLKRLFCMSKPTPFLLTENSRICGVSIPIVCS